MLGSFFYFPDGAISKWSQDFVIVVIAGLFWFSDLFILKKILSSKPLVFFGAISYPLYLIHCNLGRYITKEVAGLSGSVGLGLCVAFGCVIAVSTVLAFQVDNPLRKCLKEKWK